MTKKMDTDAITNELAGSSVFFQKPQKGPKAQLPTLASSAKHSRLYAKKQDRKPKQTSKTKDSALQQHKRNNAKQEEHIADDQAIELASYHASTVENIRKIVKNNGREVTYIRLSPEEKQKLKDLIYTYSRQKVKTTENEIARIALNFILADYRESGKASILNKVIEALNA